MTTDTEAPPPAYPTVEAQPPSYPTERAASPFVADEKARIAATFDLSAPVSSSDPTTSLAVHPTTLQPWARVPYPEGSFIPAASWKAFVSELRGAVSPASGQKALAVLAGLGVWVGTGWAPLGGLTGALIWKKATEKRVAEDLAAMQLHVAPTDAKNLHSVVERYNGLWQGLGVRVRLDAVDKSATYLCQCAQTMDQPPMPRQRGCCGNGGGCGGRRKNKCATCGKWRGRNGGNMREQIRRPIVQITVERVPRGGDFVHSIPSTPSTPGAMTPVSEATLPDERYTMVEKEKWIEVTDGKGM